MLWSSTLDNYWNDLALKPVYLPFVHEVVRHLATYEEPANWFTIGEVVDPGHLLRASGLGMQSGTGAMVLTPSGQRIEQSGTPTPVQLDQPGFYEVHGRSNQSGTVSHRGESRHARVRSHGARHPGADRRARRTSGLGESRPQPMPRRSRRKIRSAARTSGGTC